MSNTVERYRKAAMDLFGANRAEAERYIVAPADDRGEWAPQALAIIYLEPDMRFPEDTGCIPDCLGYYGRNGFDNCLSLGERAGEGFVEREGDFDALLEVLDPDVVFRVDAGRGPHARPPAVGATAVARELLTRAPRFAPLAHPAIVNGGAGLYLGPAQRPAAVVGFTVVDVRIAAIDLVVDRDKLRQVAGN